MSNDAPVQMLKVEHDNLKAEIDTREETFNEVIALGEVMVSEKHHAINEVKQKTQQKERDCKLHGNIGKLT